MFCFRQVVRDEPRRVVGAHLQLFGGRGLIDKKCSRHYKIKHLISINVDIERPDDGNIDRIRRMYAKTRAKISCGLVTPYQC